MASQLCFVVVVRSEITMQNALVAAACAQKIAGPGDRADTAIVPKEGLYYFAFNCVPDLQLACVSTHCEQITLF